MARRIVDFLLHIPKCAGTTVERHFREHLGQGFLLAPRWNNPLRDVVGNRYPGLDAPALAPVRVVSGHSLSRSMRRLFPDAEIRESVLLRDPTGFLLSFYNYRWARFDRGLDGRPPDFETWYRAQRRNPITRFLLVRYFGQGVPALYRMSSADRLAWLEARLARFHFVGSYRRADEMIARISRELGLPEKVEHQNVTPGRRLSAADLAPALAARLREANALDQALWERWKDRGWSQGALPPAPPLPRADHARYAAGDMTTAILKKLIR